MSQEKKKIRERFRKEVFSRDEYSCKICGIGRVLLDAHHIIDRNLMANGGYVKENGITLCNEPGGCHEKAEVFHVTGTALPGFSPEELFAKIDSSYEKALRASKKL